MAAVARTFRPPDRPVHVTKTLLNHLSTDASEGGGGDEVTERPVNATLRDSSDPSLNPRVPLATLPVMFM